MGEFKNGTCWTNRRSILWDSDFLKKPYLAQFLFNSHKNLFGDSLLFDNEFAQKWSESNAQSISCMQYNLDIRCRLTVVI